MHNDDVIRAVESEVLDRHCKQFSLLRRNEAVAVQSLLLCYAQVLRNIRTGRIAMPTDHVKLQRINEGIRGLGHCLRWVAENCPSTLLVPTPAPSELNQEALELLRWGADYDPIWNQHSAYSRGHIKADVDEQHKVITFQPQRKTNPRFFCTQVEAKKADDERLASARPDAQLAALSETWYDSVTSSVHGIHFDDANIRASGAIDVAVSWMEMTCLPELPDPTGLMGCTVGDLRRVLAAVYVYSLFLTKLEDASDDQPALGVMLPPCIIIRPRGQMIEWLARLSGTRSASVEAILSLVTFDPTHHHVTLAQQPFVSLRDGRLLFLPRMMCLLDLPRMYVSALNKTKTGKAIYAQTINRIEAAGVQWIAQDVRGALSSTIQLAEKRTFFTPNGPIEPDLVLTSGIGCDVLVIDVKYATPPFGPADVDRDVQEMAKWMERMSRYVTSFQNNPDILTQHFQWTCQEIMAIFGLIVTRWPLPIPIDFAAPVGVVDWPSLRERIQTTDASSIRDLVRWAIDRPDMRMPASLALTARRVRAGEWEYRFSVMTLLPNDRLFDLTQNSAYELWEQRGKPLWDDQRDWFAAENDLMPWKSNV